MTRVSVDYRFVDPEGGGRQSDPLRSKGLSGQGQGRQLVAQHQKRLILPGNSTYKPGVEIVKQRWTSPVVVKVH
jgi:hypothetical protein